MRLATRKFSLAGLMVFVATIALMGAGCQTTSTSTNTGPSDIGTAAQQVFQYDEAGASDLATLDPDIVEDANSVPFIDLIYGQLVTQDQKLNIIPWDAAALPTVSSDGKTYTFHLRSGLKFSNGTPETSADFAYSINRSQNPCLASPVNGYLAGLNGALLLKDAATFFGEPCKNGVITGAIQTLIGDSIQTPDNQTLVLTLSAPAAYFLETLTYPTSYALDPAVVGSDPTSEKWLDTLSQGAHGQGTSGMYYVSSWDHAAGTLVLKPNPNFWGATSGQYKPFLNEIDLTVFKSSDTSYAAYQSGQFSVGFPTAPLLPQARTQPDFHQSGILEFSGFVFNWTKAPFNDLNARKAACLAINRDQINTSILNNADKPAWNIVPPGMPGYNPNAHGPDNVTATGDNSAQAKTDWQAYLTSAGSAAVKSWPYLYVAASTTQAHTAQAIQQYWEQELGVTVTLKGEDFNTWLNDQSAGNFVATRFAWLDDYPDAQDFLSLLFHTGANYNSQKASIPAADALMDQADVNTNAAQRATQYNQAEQDIIDQVGFCPAFIPQQFWQSRQYIKNWSLNSGGLTSLPTWAASYIAKH